MSMTLLDFPFLLSMVCGTFIRQRSSLQNNLSLKNIPMAQTGGSQVSCILVNHQTKNIETHTKKNIKYKVKIR